MSRSAWLIIVLFIVMSSGLAALVPSRVIGMDDGDAPQSINAIPPDEPLRGADVVRRDLPDDLPRMTKTWTRVFDGAKTADGGCGYSLEFFEPYEEAAPKVFTMTAVNTKTCQVEFEIGIPEQMELPNLEGGKWEGVDEEATVDSSETASAAKRAFTAPGALAELASGRDAVPLLNGRERKIVVIGKWQDPDLIDADITMVLKAVKSEVERKDIVGAKCRSGWWGFGITGWEVRNDGQWNDTTCTYNDRRLKGEVNAHFINRVFPGCVPTLHIYYDRLWAKVTSEKGGWPEGYAWGVHDTWWEGGPCGVLIRWVGFDYYPDEFWGFD